MTRLSSATALVVFLSISLTSCTQAPVPAQSPVVVAVPAKAGAVQGKPENSDAFLWGLFTKFTAPNAPNSPRPVAFETWASDKDTFSFTPHWPTASEPLDLHPSVLGELSMPGLVQNLSDSNEELLNLLKQPIDVTCEPPPGAAVGGFPTTGTPPPCIAEQVVRNRVEYEYIVNNHLNTQVGLAVAYKNSLNVEMPPEAIGLKGDWVPVAALQQWVPQAGDLANIRKLYFTATVDKIEFALVSMHVASRQNPNWVWGTFEHEMNPGRCDYIGCFDTFGAQVPAVAPNRTAYNSQYGACAKTKQLKALMASANLSPVWDNYCLKSTQVDFVASDGTPYALGNSVIEGIVGNGTVAISSCITCHYYASFGPTGAVAPSAKAILPFNPVGNPIPGVLNGSLTFAFNWGVLLAPDVFSGNWKMNLAKSKYDPANLAPQNAGTSKIDAIEHGLKFINDGVDPAGKPTHSAWSGKFDGKDNPVKGDSGRDTAALTKIDDYTIQIISKKAGKVVNTNRVVLSRDGKTRTQTGEGTDAQGRKFNNTVVYERQ